MGKSRLAQEALAIGERHGLATRWAIATESTRRLPLGAFAAWVGQVGTGDQLQVLIQAANAITSTNPPVRVVLGIDDAHLLDPLSAQLVHHLALQRKAVLVITVRSGEPTPEAVTALWKDGYVDRHEVLPLSEVQTLSVLEEALAGQVAGAAVTRLWRLTQGNVLSLRLLVDQAVETGRLTRVSDVWQLSAAPEVPPSLAELIAARVSSQAKHIQDVVDLLALGEPLSVSLLAGLTDAATVEDAESAGLLMVQPEGRRLQVRLAHPLYSEVRRTTMGLLRARRLRGRIVIALTDAGSRRADDALRRAILAVDSDLPPDAALLADAAATAIRLMDLTLAEQLARSAIDAGSGIPARWVLANSLAWQGKGAETEAEWAQLADLADDDIQRALVAMPRAGNLFWIMGEPDVAEAVLTTATATVHDAGAQLVMTALRAAFHAFLGRPRPAVDDAFRALAVAELPDQAVVLATWGMTIGLGLLGRADEIGAGITRAHAAATRCVEGPLLRLGLDVLALVSLHLSGYLDQMSTVAAQHRQLGFGTVQHDIVFDGYEMFARGKLRTAVRKLREVRSQHLTADVASMIKLTMALAMSGDRVGARAAMAELRTSRHPSHVFMDPEVLLAQAWLAAADGAISEAVRLTHEAATLAAGRGQLAHEVFALQTAVCFGDHTVAARLAHLATMVDGPRAPATAEHAAALAADDGDRLMTASHRWEDIGDMIAATDAAAQAATAYTFHGRRGSAIAAATRTDHLAAACEGAHTPAVRLAAQPLPLTGREREIATLAANGLTNREIADRLVVSVRTVEGHLYRANAKLGTSSRADLAYLLGGSGPP